VERLLSNDLLPRSASIAGCLSKADCRKSTLAGRRARDEALAGSGPGEIDHSRSPGDAIVLPNSRHPHKTGRAMLVLIPLALLLALASVACFFLFKTAKGLVTGVGKIGSVVRRRDEQATGYWIMIMILAALCLAFGMLTNELLTDMLMA
jgi:hypothetical protein